MGFDTSYLNRTANKWPRQASQQIEFVVWHETASPNPLNPQGTLDYNLSAAVESSYNYLIARDGRIFHYVDERSWISYHAGLHSAARGYVEWGVNTHSIGVELDGPNNGEPITAAQRDAIIALMLYFKETYGIPIRREYHLGHKEVAPGYKSDPRGYSLDLAVHLAQQAEQKQLPTSNAGTPVVAPPRISLKRWTEELAAAMSPVAAQAAELYGIPLEYGLDPAVALAFFHHESQYGTDGLCAKLDLKNWGSVRTPYNKDLKVTIVETELGGFVCYTTWAEGLRDWCERLINRYIHDRGLTTVQTIIPTYAPRSDGNDERAYIAAVEKDLARWGAGLLRYVVTAPVANVRQGPGRNFLVAGTMKQGEILVADGVTLGERIGGVDGWPHLAIGLGFMHLSLLEQQP